MPRQLDSGKMPFLAIIFVLFSLKCSILASTENPTTAAATDSEEIATTLAPFLPISAEKLVRYRRHPPVKVKHVIRAYRSKPHRHHKRPKAKHVPPTYIYTEPITYYKEKQPHHSLVEGPAESPAFSIDDFHHFDVDGADFDSPPSSYESQTMDLDFYSHADTSYHTAPKAPNIEYSFHSEDESPSYSYIPHVPSKPEAHTPRAPHQKYGAPGAYEYPYEGFSSHFGTAHSASDAKYHAPADDDSFYGPAYTYHGDSYVAHPQDSYEPPLPAYTQDQQRYHPAYSASVPSTPVHKHPTQYGGSTENRPDSYAPPNVQNDYHPSSGHEQHVTYDHTNANSAYGSSSAHHHFAEPPSSRPAIEITYSPSYEINLPPSKTREDAPFKSYETAAPVHSHPGNFAEPPEHPVAPPHPPPPLAPQYTDTTPQSYHPQPSSIEDYLPPPAQELPLNTQHKQPTYSFPKSSYEVPIYDPVPFDASNKEEQELFPPHSYDNLPADHFPYQPYQPVSTLTLDQSNQEVLDVHRPTTDSSTETFRQDAHTSGSSTASVTGYSPQPRRTRKRKRVRGNTTTTSVKHILDVPELEEAFQAEADNRYKYSHDTDANASTYVEQKQRYQKHIIAPTPDSDHYIGNAWNPMRIRTSAGMAPTPETTTTTALERPTPYTRSTRARTPFKPSSRPSSAQPHSESFTISPKLPPTVADSKGDNSDTVDVLSIERSRSQSYYDGTVAPPTLAATNLYKSRLNKFKAITRSSVMPPLVDKGASVSNRTTKSVFETTYFKHPNNSDEQTERRLSLPVQNLPKNHKPY